MRVAIATLVLIGVVFGPRSLAEEARSGKYYSDGHGGKVFLPLGDISFADRVHSMVPGERAPTGVPADPQHSVGLPDYTRPSEPGFTSLGCNGTLVVEFQDNVLIDVEGPDLFVFEVGPLVEAMDLAVSRDGNHWLEVGRIEGARADIDIAAYVEPGDTFHFVRLTNAGSSCGGASPGADIDAVAAVGSGYRLSLDSAVLFDVGKFELKPEALKELDRVVREIAGFPGDYNLVIEGHTDSTGTDADNLRLSRNRAQAVSDALSSLLNLEEANSVTRGYGESRPVADNRTEEGRARNRRVDLLILPR